MVWPPSRSPRCCTKSLKGACLTGKVLLLCCRILAGWVPGSERETLGLSDMAPGPAGSAPVPRRYTLWPYDRPESKGQLKGVTLRIEDGKVLVLGFRWVAFLHLLMSWAGDHPLMCIVVAATATTGSGNVPSICYA